MAFKYSRFGVRYKREKCPPRVETAAGKRQTREMSGHVTLCRSRGKNTGCLISLMLNLNDSDGRIDVTETFLICLEGTELGVRKGA